jgi:hypothetical protein
MGILSKNKGGFFMVKKNVKLFYEALIKDKGLQERFKAISKKYEGQKLEEAQVERIYRNELLPLAGEAGFNFTLAELKVCAAETRKTAMHELSEQELAAVAGGLTFSLFFAGDNVTS